MAGHVELESFMASEGFQEDHRIMISFVVSVLNGAVLNATMSLTSVIQHLLAIGPGVASEQKP